MDRQPKFNLQGRTAFERVIAADTGFIAEFVSAVHRGEDVPEIDFISVHPDMYDADIYRRINEDETSLITTFCRAVDYDWIDAYVEKNSPKMLKTQTLISRLIEVYRRSYGSVTPNDHYCYEDSRQHWGDLKILNLNIDNAQFFYGFGEGYPRDFYFLNMVYKIAKNLQNSVEKNFELTFEG